MTAQIGEIISYKGEDLMMASEPLNSYLASRRFTNFDTQSTACWRNYYGKWAIKNNKLYLVDFEAYINGGHKVDLNYLFPNAEEVFANWFTGDIRIPTGKLLKYVHMGYASIFEKDLILQFRNGILLSEKEINNREGFGKKLFGIMKRLFSKN